MFIYFWIALPSTFHIAVFIDPKTTYLYTFCLNDVPRKSLNPHFLNLCNLFNLRARFVIVMVIVKFMISMSPLSWCTFTRPHRWFPRDKINETTWTSCRSEVRRCVPNWKHCYHITTFVKAVNGTVCLSFCRLLQDSSRYTILSLSGLQEFFSCCLRWCSGRIPLTYQLAI